MDIYLHFNGNCREAFDFYRSVFGGEFESISTFRDMPPGEMEVAEKELDQVMHVALPLGNGNLMGSDMPAAFGPPKVMGDNFSIVHSVSSVEEVDSLFAKLSEGGMVQMAPTNTFWGSYFASFTDKFGVGWNLDHWLSEPSDD